MLFVLINGERSYVRMLRYDMLYMMYDVYRACMSS